MKLCLLPSPGTTYILVKQNITRRGAVLAKSAKLLYSFRFVPVAKTMGNDQEFIQSNGTEG